MMAFASTVASVLFIVIQVGIDTHHEGNLNCQQGHYDNQTGIFQPEFPESLNVRDYFASVGTIMFAFGGTTMFPTIQVDMKNPENFTVAVLFGMTSN